MHARFLIPFRSSVSLQTCIKGRAFRNNVMVEVGDFKRADPVTKWADVACVSDWGRGFGVPFIP